MQSDNLFFIFGVFHTPLVLLSPKSVHSCFKALFSRDPLNFFLKIDNSNAHGLSLFERYRYTLSQVKRGNIFLGKIKLNYKTIFKGNLSINNIEKTTC